MKIQEYINAIRANGHPNVEKADERLIRVMTSNVLHSRAGDIEKKTWEDRVSILSAVYLTFLPDFIGLQEVSYQQTDPFLRALSEVYATPDTPLGDFVNYPYHGVDYIQNHTPILYNKHKYEVLDSRYHIFPNDDLHSYQWALYRLKDNPEQKIIHMNMHPHSNSNINMPGFVDAHDELAHLRRHYPTTPIFLTGDYNACYTEKQMEVLFDGLSMTSGMLVAEQGDPCLMKNHPLGSMKIYAPDRSPIDHVGVTTDLIDVKLFRLLLDEVIAKGSDHCPLFIDAEIKTAN
ncbi:MAG: endonuclease/exonuclease/phosphatase family protein [Clostridia bacterium]|nr:endonuclease/exonuclease/phosphatase family protein [Clostridia bacterium]